MSYNLIQHLLKNNGKLQEGETWYQLGVKFNVEPPNMERAKEDEEYRKNAITKKANDAWRHYCRQKESLELTKETYKDGQLSTEVFTKQNSPDNIPVEDIEEYEIEKFTTNPKGGAWLKYKKIEKIYDEDHTQNLVDILTKEITPIDYKPMINTNNLGLFIYGADKHIGALTKEDSMYNNKYDREEIKQRIIKGTIRNIEKSIKYFGNFESLYIMDLGDALDGFNQKTVGGLRGTSLHTLPQQMNNREQHDFYVEVHRELFDYIMSQEYAKNVYFIATSNSNHGGDFEYGAMRNLETYLNVKYPDIKTFVNYYPFNHFIYGNHAIIFGHGKDMEDMKHGLPLNLNEKTEVYLNDYIETNKLQDYHVTVVMGDLHQSNENYGKNFRYKRVLSQYGSSKWSHTNFGSGNAGLSFEVMDKFTPMVFKIDDFFQKGVDQSNTGIDL